MTSATKTVHCSRWSRPHCVWRHRATPGGQAALGCIARRFAPRGRTRAGPCRTLCHPISLVLPKETGVVPQRKTPHCVWEHSQAALGCIARPGGPRAGNARRHSAAPGRGEGNDKGERLCKTIMQGRKPLHYFSERFLFVLSKKHLPPHFFGLAQRNGCGAPKKNAGRRPEAGRAFSKREDIC